MSREGKKKGIVGKHSTRNPHRETSLPAFCSGSPLRAPLLVTFSPPWDILSSPAGDRESLWHVDLSSPRHPDISAGSSILFPASELGLRIFSNEIFQTGMTKSELVVDESYHSPLGFSTVSPEHRWDMGPRPTEQGLI